MTTNDNKMTMLFKVKSSLDTDKDIQKIVLFFQG